MEAFAKHSVHKPPMSIQSLWACDVNQACRAWLQQHLRPKHVFIDMNARLWRDDAITMRGKDAQPVTFTRAEANLDLYVVGFMCTPFSDKGLRQGWQDEASNTFISAIRTLKTLRPRVAVFENVTGLERTGCLEEVERILKLVPGYTYRVLRLNSKNFGVPQHRNRLYIVMLKTADLASPPQQCHRNICQIVANCYHTAAPFTKWLAEAGLPLAAPTPCPPTVSSSSTLPTSCMCGPRAICPMHPCQCILCKKFGEDKKKCVWRQHILQRVKQPLERRRTRAYLKMWRQVRKNPSLKQPPTYLQLLNARGRALTLTSPRERCMLQALGSVQNLVSENTILDISQSISRVALRSDGCVPTLTTTCGNLFVPSRAVALDHKQLLALQGICPDLAAAVECTPEQICKMAGNAMTLPLVGTVLVAALSQLIPQ
jgi:site-specific DNA-cytosine methylase